MNNKMVGCILLLVAALVVFQVGMSIRSGATTAESAAESAGGEEVSLQTQLTGKRAQLVELKESSQQLLGLISKWKPWFALTKDRSGAEAGMTMKVRSSKLLNISQRYQAVPHIVNGKPADSLPILIRSSLVFEDQFRDLLNWVGDMEKTKPTMRVSKVEMTKGSRGEDIRMEMVLEIPLRAAGSES